MHLALVISALDDGGAQRVISLLANHWAARGRRVTLITLAPSGTDFFPLDPGIRRVGLGLQGPSRHALQGLVRNLRRWQTLRRALRREAPDAIVSFGAETNILTLASSLGLGRPVLVAVRTDPARHPVKRVWRWLRRRLYPRAGAVVAQTEAAARWLRRAVPAASIAVIPNPAAPPESDDAPPAALPHRGPFVVALGRLSREKGFDLLVDAFARCAAAHAGWSLVIVGDGPERSALEAQSSRLGLADRVHLPGRVARPGGILRRAGLFVLPSRYEGFPNSLLEAMACGLPVVAVDCSSGPRDIVRPGVDGLLVPPEDPGSLAAAMDRLMSDPSERRRLGTAAVEVLRRFDPDAVIAMWDALIDRATRGRAR